MSQNICIFCKTVAGEMPSEKIYADETVEAILDIAPMNPGHTLVMPKQHIEFFVDVPADLMTPLMQGVQTVAAAQMKALGTTGFSLKLNNGKVAGQLVPHIHVHVIPRFAEDTLVHWPGGRYRDGEMEEMGDKLRAALAL